MTPVINTDLIDLIYNFKKLKQVLSSIQFKSSSDTEVLFYYLVNFGIEKTLQDIQGMFAFSFYDIDIE